MIFYATNQTSRKKLYILGDWLNLTMTSLLNLLLFIYFTCISCKPLKTVLITGANSGVGYAATKILAASNSYNVIMACRSPEKAFLARDKLGEYKNNVQVVKLDLADLNSVKDMCTSFKGIPIDCIVCNAGVQESTSGLGGKEANSLAKRTAQDYEITVGTNHIGHFLLLKLLLDNVKKVPDGRIVILGSGVHDPESPGGKVGSKVGQNYYLVNL